MVVASQTRRAADRLRDWMHDRIRARGPLAFVEFMEAALYHPEHGYYCREEMTTGPRGDFYTSPDLHPAFGLLIARQIAEIARLTGAGEASRFHVVEAGPGSGRLARDIIAGLAAENPDLARRCVYTLVEISPSLRRAQRGTIEGAGVSDQVAVVRWLRWDELLLDAGEGMDTCVVANEYLDALPVRIVERRDGRLEEVHVVSRGNGFAEVLIPTAASERLAAHFEDLGVDLLEGQRAEVGQRALDWIAGLGDLFGARGRGGAILIDYGYPASELYGPSRRRGTLMGYRRHRAVEDPYAHVGEQDMTAHVDFTSVAARARGAGFDVAGPVSQMRFLVSLGLAEMLAGAASEPAAGARAVADRLALHSLMAPGGMGEIFKVLLLERGASAGALTGAKDPFR